MSYALRWLLGAVARVSCMFGDCNVVDMTAEDTAVVRLKFRNGNAAEMTCTFGIAHRPVGHSISLHGSDGYLTTSSILEGAPTRQTGEDGKRAVEIVQAAYRSTQTGHTVDLPLTE